LWLPQSSNVLNDRTLEKIDNSDAVVAEFRNEQALAFQIDRHVVDPAAHVAEWDFAFQV
jgi:hypothetical protein